MPIEFRLKDTIEDRGDLGTVELENQAKALIAATRGDPNITFAFTLFRAKVPQLFVNVDRQRAMQMGVPINSVFDTLQIYLGSAYVNDFNRDGRTWQVTARREYRQRHQGGRGRRREDAAAADRHRVDRVVVPANPGRVRCAVRLRRGGSAGLPRPGGP